MSENKKFTTEELDQIKKLREGNATLIQQFGQVKVEKKSYSDSSPSFTSSIL